MTRLAARFSLLALSALLGACAQHHAIAMRGNANGVMINYVGDVSDTLPVARQHCAQYERVPVLRLNKDDYATYDCVTPNGASRIGS
jgi:hypothetical protein